jgi:hypothetical protein
MEVLLHTFLDKRQYRPAIFMKAYVSFVGYILGYDTTCLGRWSRGKGWKTESEHDVDVSSVRAWSS